MIETQIESQSTSGSSELVGPVTSWDIKSYCDTAQFASNDVKHYLILNREPEISLKYPAKQYKDKRSKSAYMNIFCCREWFKKFDFISYSKCDDGLYCLACVLFPDISHRKPKKLITEPYKNWKDAVEDLKKHAACDYHGNSLSKLRCFMETYADPTSRVDVLISDETSKRVRTNREVLRNLIKCLEFCGRQGIALRGHRDDDTTLKILRRVSPRLSSPP